jgi:hypothetical protein
VSFVHKTHTTASHQRTVGIAYQGSQRVRAMSTGRSERTNPFRFPLPSHDIGKQTREGCQYPEILRYRVFAKTGKHAFLIRLSRRFRG